MWDEIGTEAEVEAPQLDAETDDDARLGRDPTNGYSP